MDIEKIKKKTIIFFENLDKKNTFIKLCGVILALYGIAQFYNITQKMNTSFKINMLLVASASLLLSLMIFKKYEKTIKEIWFLPSILILIFVIYLFDNESSTAGRWFVNALMYFLISKFIKSNYIITNKERSLFNKALYVIIILGICFATYDFLCKGISSLSVKLNHIGPFVILGYYHITKKRVPSICKWMIFLVFLILEIRDYIGFFSVFKTFDAVMIIIIIPFLQNVTVKGLIFVLLDVHNKLLYRIDNDKKSP